MRRVLKWIGIALGSLLLLVLVAGTVIYFVGRSRVNRTYPVEGFVAAQPPDAGVVARGEHVMRIHACQECHGEDLSGKVFLDIPPGLIVASNLTPGRGGVGGEYSLQNWESAVRRGVRADGRALLPMMPYELYHNLSDEDMADLAAYLESLPPVDNALPRTKLKLPGYLMAAFMPLGSRAEHGDSARHEQPPVAPTAEYGRYLAASTCIECHGENLEGGKHPDPSGPPAPGLAHTSVWTPEQFARAMRQGVAPNGRQMTHWMPWKYFSHMTDVEVQALHAYAKTLPSTPPATD